MEAHADGKRSLRSRKSAPDGTYLQYLRAMYGGKIHLLTDEDLQTSFQDSRRIYSAVWLTISNFPTNPANSSRRKLRADANGDSK